jgi:hypothetical protein
MHPGSANGYEKPEEALETQSPVWRPARPGGCASVVPRPPEILEEPEVNLFGRFLWAWLW